MASTIPPPNRVKLLYNRLQILNIIFGILIGLIAVLRWYTGRDEFDGTAFLISLADSSMLTLVCILPQYMITIYCYFRKESCVGLESYISTGAMVLDEYVALLMINTGYFRILLFPAMILFFIITLGWKLRKSETVEVVGNQQKTNEETPSVTRTDSSDKLELFGFVSYLLLLSLVTWTRYKGQQGCTPVLSDFLLFLGSAVGALGTMLASPLADVNSGAVSEEVLPVLHRTCAVVLFIAVHTLAAEWLGEDMIYVCLPELITVLVWFTVCFGESTSVSSLTSYISQATIVGSVVAVLACLIPWNANDWNIPVSWIMWLFWISISSAAFSQFHVWLLQGWPESSSEPNKLICLLNVAHTVCSATAAILSLCAYMMITETMILYEAIYSFQPKAMAAVTAIIFLLRFLVRSACYFFGYLETHLQIQRAPMLDELQVTDVTILQPKQVGTPFVSKYEIDPINKESYEILEQKKSHRNPEHESQEILEEQKPNEYDERSEGRTPDKSRQTQRYASFADDEKPPTPSAGSTKGGLVLIKPVKYFKEDAALTADTVTAEVEINASSSTATREGLDLVVVLDISGSMKTQDRIGKMKKAMHFVIMKLTPMDRLTIVAFSNKAGRCSILRCMTPSAQMELIHLVDQFMAEGGTDIESGLYNAAAVVKERVYTTGRTANIFLMSDGQQSTGDAMRVDLADVPVYTFGFGKEADQKLLSDIAGKSLGGTFSSVPDGTNLSIPFSQLLGGLLTIVAQNVQLTLKPNKADDDVAGIEVSPGTKYKQDTNPGTGVITIKFGTLFAGEGRRVVITLGLKESAVKDEYDATLAEAQHSYTVQGKLQKQTPQDILILRTQNPSEAPGTGIKARQLQAEMARRDHAVAIGEARELADQKLLNEAKYKLMDAMNALEDIVLNDGGKLVNGLRAELGQLFKLMDTQELYEAQGRAYALASETSHGRQRYAARGGHEANEVRMFSTPRMDEYLEQAKNFDKDPSAPVPSADNDAKKELEANPLAAIGPELAV